MMHSGQPILDSLKEADRKTLIAKYNEIGCIDTQILPDPRIHRRAGRRRRGLPDRGGRTRTCLGELIIRGNERTRDKVIRREAAMAGLLPGELLNMNRIETLQEAAREPSATSSTAPDQGKPIDIKIINRRPADKPYGDVPMPTSRRREPDPDAEPGPRSRSAGAAARRPPVRPIGGRPRPARRARAGVRRRGGAVPGPLPPVGPRCSRRSEATAGPFSPAGRHAADRTVPTAPAIPVPSPARRHRAGRRAPDAAASAPASRPGMFPSVPGLNMTDVGPDRQDPFPNRAYADIITSVEEAPTGRFMLGVGASGWQGLNGTVTITEKNFDIFNVPRIVGRRRSAARPSAAAARTSSSRSWRAP